MIQISIGDIHGRTMWKRIVEDNQDADRFIFIGDYLDSFDVKPVDQMQNLLDIIEFKKATKKEVILLIGNHDFHYWPNVHNPCSGYQSTMHDSFEIIFTDNAHLFQMAFVDENENVYTHAGITESFLHNNSVGGTDIKTIVGNINELFYCKPNRFSFYPGDSSDCGEHIFQSPIWVRSQSLYRDNIKQNQIVGHSPQNRIDKNKSKRQGYWLIDTLGTTQEYLRIEDGEIKVKRLGK